MSDNLGVPISFDDSLITPSHEAAQVVCADMPEAVLDGRLGEICQQRMRRFPIAYAWIALTTTAGALVERGNCPIRTNLYGALVGSQGSGKSQSNETAFQLLGMTNNPILLEAKFGSAEALIERLQDIGSDAVRLIYPDELGHLLSKAAIERSSFPFVLNTAFYRDRQEGGTKGHPYSLDCRLSVLGGVVEENFADAFGLATTGGLWDRFIFGLCPQPYQFLYRPFEGDSKCITSFAADISSDVWEARDQWVTKEAIAPRVAELSLRVAYICASIDGRPRLRAADLEPALAFAKYQMRVRRVLAPNPGENPDARCAIAVRNWLVENAHDGRWTSRRHLDRALNSSRRFGPGVFVRCLKNLYLNGEIDIDDRKKLMRLKGENE